MVAPILLTTDFSDLARRAYPHALRLARAQGRPIRMLTVLETLVGFEPGPTPAGDWQTRILDAAELELREEAASLQGQGVDVSLRVRIGLPALEIAREAETGAAALVMATHGIGGFRRFFPGSTLLKVLRRSPAPVLVVGPDAPDRDVTRVLVPLDFSELSSGALREALAIVSRYAAAAELYHVVVPRYAPLVIPGIGADLGALDEQPADRRARAEAGLARAARFASEQDVAVTTLCEDGVRAAESIAERAEAMDADLVIVPAHGTRGFTRFLLGSVAEEVVRRCPRPVLVLRLDGEGA